MHCVIIKLLFLVCQGKQSYVIRMMITTVVMNCPFLAFIAESGSTSVDESFTDSNTNLESLLIQKVLLDGFNCCNFCFRGSV